MKLILPTLTALLLGLLAGCSSTDEAEFDRPKDAVSRFRQGEALVHQYRFKEALPHLEEALQVQPDYRRCRVLYAQTLIAVGRLLEDEREKALSEAKQLRSQAGKEAEAAALEQTAIAKHEEAEPYFNRALKELNLLKKSLPGNPYIYIHMATVYLYYEQLESSKRSFEEALSLLPEGSPDVEDIKRVIETIDEEMARRAFVGVP